MSANLSAAFCGLTQTEALVDLSGPNLLGNTALDPKAPIHQADECRGSHTKEKGVDKPSFQLRVFIFKPGYTE